MFYQPRELSEALRLRAELGPEVVTVCGGTDLVVAVNHRAIQPRGFLDLSRVADFDYAVRADGMYVLGAGATFARLAKLPVPALAEAARSVGGPQIRHRGTIGGNLATASPAGDGSVALLALEAQVEMAHAERGARWVALPDFFLDYRRTALGPDELITRLRFPADGQSAWYKIGKRGAVNISIVCCAVGKSPAGEYRIALGSVAPYPLRAGGAEKLLSGQALTDDSIERAAQAAAAAAAPIDDQRGSARYRRAMCRTLTGRLLRQLDQGA